MISYVIAYLIVSLFCTTLLVLLILLGEKSTENYYNLFTDGEDSVCKIKPKLWLLLISCGLPLVLILTYDCLALVVNHVIY